MAAANLEFFAFSRQEAANGLCPHEHSIAPGTVLYRFIDVKHKPPEDGADGPWWFEYEHFQSIKHFSIKHGYSLGYSARLFAAILYEWSEVNAVVRAKVIAPLAVWKGRGKAINVVDDLRINPRHDARDKNRVMHGLITERTPTAISRMIPMQGPNEVYQLYIPGLGRPNYKFSSYFEFLGFEPIITG